MAPPKGKPFPKGKSGNPSGRKAVPPELRMAFEEHSHEAAEVLFELMKRRRKAFIEGAETEVENEPEIRLKAACTVLDRHLGKPAQAVEVGTKAGTPLDGLLTKLDAALDTLEPGQLLELAIGK